MKSKRQFNFTVLVILMTAILSAFGFLEPTQDVAKGDSNVTSRVENTAVTLEEARTRSKLLHATIHGTLQVMHRDFFDPEDRNRIPSASLEDVFKELSNEWDIEIRWLGVNAKTMDVDHEAHDEFERNAVKALSAGKREFELVEKNRYRFVGAIVLHNVCLKCHVPNRTSLEDRTAGLAITMPYGSNEQKEGLGEL